jgi:hypothetical protein
MISPPPGNLLILKSLASMKTYNLAIMASAICLVEAAP